MSKPETVAGGVTVNGPNPLLTVGALGAAGKIITLTVLLAPHDPVLAVPAGVPPHADAKTYCACIV